jgi:hypothetical protein
MDRGYPLMQFMSRPWSPRHLSEEDGFGPADCLLSHFEGGGGQGIEAVSLMKGSVRGREMTLTLHPYPKRDHGQKPKREGFPVRPRNGHKPTTDGEVLGASALKRMNEVIARVQELEDALDDPADMWGRLREAWKRAEDEADPKMSEIVRQARKLQPVLRDLKVRIRRVLRRDRELTPLARVQEMDRASMVWLSRQAGRNVAERAGAGQRILATVRKENFDTLENRVLHAHVRLAADVAREWMREHPLAKDISRYAQVSLFGKQCRSLGTELERLGVMVAQSDVTPNYVLMQDRSYREVYEGWIRLLQRRKIEDDLWAWQAETWTDFATLAIILAVDELDESILVAQSPISWRAEAVGGRWFEQDRPIAVFWLQKTGRIVEIQARPEVPGALLMAARAHLALRITDPQRADIPRRVAVWTPHAIERIDLDADAQDAAGLLEQVQALTTNEIMRHGLILTPAHGRAQTVTDTKGRVSVHGVALGASGETLAEGLAAVRGFVRGEIYRETL